MRPLRPAVAAGLRMTLISEAHDAESHRRIQAEAQAALAAARPPVPDDDTRPLGSGRVAFPEEVPVRPEGDDFVPVTGKTDGRPSAMFGRCLQQMLSYYLNRFGEFTRVAEFTQAGSERGATVRETLRQLEL